MKCPRCNLDVPARTDSLRYCVLCNVWYQVDGGRLRRMRSDEVTRAEKAERPIMQAYPIHALIAQSPLPRLEGLR